MGEKDDDLEREIRAHLELEAEERIANGMSHDEARDAARRAFGNVTRVREDARSVWIAPWIDHAFQDLRYAARRLRRAPAFALTAIGILTVGIALNLAFFQLLNVAALRPLPVADLDTLVRFDRIAKRFRSNGIPFPATQFIRDHNDVLSAVLTSHASDVVWGDDPNDRLDALYVSANWFTQLGSGAALGRVFVDADERPDAEPVSRREPRVLAYASSWRAGGGPDRPNKRSARYHRRRRAERLPWPGTGRSAGLAADSPDRILQRRDPVQRRLGKPQHPAVRQAETWCLPRCCHGGSTGNDRGTGGHSTSGVRARRDSAALFGSRSLSWTE